MEYTKELLQKEMVRIWARLWEDHVDDAMYIAEMYTTEEQREAELEKIETGDEYNCAENEGTI